MNRGVAEGHSYQIIEPACTDMRVDLMKYQCIDIVQGDVSGICKGRGSKTPRRETKLQLAALALSHRPAAGAPPTSTVMDIE